MELYLLCAVRIDVCDLGSIPWRPCLRLASRFLWWGCSSHGWVYNSVKGWIRVEKRNKWERRFTSPSCQLATFKTFLVKRINPDHGMVECTATIEMCWLSEETHVWHEVSQRIWTDIRNTYSTMIVCGGIASQHRSVIGAWWDIGLPVNKTSVWIWEYARFVVATTMCVIIYISITRVGPTDVIKCMMFWTYQMVLHQPLHIALHEASAEQSYKRKKIIVVALSLT